MLHGVYNLQPPNDTVRIINDVLFASFFFHNHLQSVNENTDNRGIPNQIEHIHDHAKDYLATGPWKHIYQCKGNHWVVPASEVLEPKLINFSLSHNIWLWNEVLEVQSEVETSKVNWGYPELVLLQDPPQEASEDMGIQHNDSQPEENNQLGLGCLMQIWIGDLAFDLFDSQGLKQSAHICQIYEHGTSHSKPLHSDVTHLDGRDEVEKEFTF